MTLPYCLNSHWLKRADAFKFVYFCVLQLQGTCCPVKLAYSSVFCAQKFCATIDTLIF